MAGPKCSGYTDEFEEEEVRVPITTSPDKTDLFSKYSFGLPILLRV